MEKEQKEKKVKTPKKKIGYNDIDLKHYNELLEKKKEVDKELKPLKRYLESIGLLTKEVKKGRNKKVIQI